MFVAEVGLNNFYNIFEGSVGGDSGDQSGVGPVELFLWLLIPAAVIALSEALSVPREGALAISKEQGFFVATLSMRSHRKFLFPEGSVTREADATVSVILLHRLGFSSMC